MALMQTLLCPKDRGRKGVTLLLMRATFVTDSFGAGDDGIAMHGQYYAVVQTNVSQHSMVIASGGGLGFNNNDTLVFYGRDTAGKGSSTVTSLHSVMQPDSTQGKINPALSDLKPFAYDDCDFMEVRFSSTEFVLTCDMSAPCSLAECRPGQRPVVAARYHLLVLQLSLFAVQDRLLLNMTWVPQAL